MQSGASKPFYVSGWHQLLVGAFPLKDEHCRCRFSVLYGRVAVAHVQPSGKGYRAVANVTVLNTRSPETPLVAFLLGRKPMRKICFIMLISLSLSGCANGMLLQPSAPSLTQMQGHCFSSYEKFSDQTACIKEEITHYPTSLQNPRIQEYLAYMQVLLTKVKRGVMSSDDARLNLVTKLNELRDKQQLEFQQNDAMMRQMQQQSEIDRNQRYMMMLNASQVTKTNCTQAGNSISCKSSQGINPSMIPMMGY